MTVIDDLLALVDRLTGRDQQPTAPYACPTEAERRAGWILTHGDEPDDE